jgi:RNA polymerase sigma factor (sigma-70 family)
MSGIANSRLAVRRLGSKLPSRQPIEEQAQSEGWEPIGEGGEAGQSGLATHQFALFLQKFSDFVESAVCRGLRAAQAAGWYAPHEMDAEAQRTLAISVRDAVCRSACKHLLGPGSAVSRPKAVKEYLHRLHVEDLTLAAACAAGHDAAWEHFVVLYRPVLRAAARAIAGPAAGDELADSLWAELYGVRGPGSLQAQEKYPVRRPLLDYYHGRSSLATWLRAVLAQRHVDLIRASRRTTQLEDCRDTDRETPDQTSRDSHCPAPPRPQFPDPDRERYVAMFERALRTAFESLEPRERLRLSYYYIHDLTLAQIGRLLGEHEATVSRYLERTRRRIRESVEQALRNDGTLAQDAPASRRFRIGGLNQQQVELCLRYALEDRSIDLQSMLSAAEPASGQPPGRHTSSPVETSREQAANVASRKNPAPGRSRYRREP